MDIALELLRQSGFTNLTIGNVVMFAVAGTLIYLAIAKSYEPLLLIPIGFAAHARQPAARQPELVRQRHHGRHL
jgi:Na+-transporting methylmalonyl-CoA/oxaloacetate decarboxylase beta subunit